MIKLKIVVGGVSTLMAALERNNKTTLDNGFHFLATRAGFTRIASRIKQYTLKMYINLKERTRTRCFGKKSIIQNAL